MEGGSAALDEEGRLQHLHSGGSKLHAGATQLGDEHLDAAGVLVVQVGEAAVKPQAHLQVFHVAFGDQHGGADVDLRRPLAIRFQRVLAGVGIRPRHPENQRLVEESAARVVERPDRSPTRRGHRCFT